MARRRGSATALNASEVVAARAMPNNTFPYRNMSRIIFDLRAPLAGLFLAHGKNRIKEMTKLEAGRPNGQPSPGGPVKIRKLFLLVSVFFICPMIMAGGNGLSDNDIA